MEGKARGEMAEKADEGVNRSLALECQHAVNLCSSLILTGLVSIAPSAEG